MSVQAMMWGGAGASLALAVLAAWREAQRKRRANLDAVGYVDWPSVQVAALVAVMIFVGVGLHS